MNTREEAIRKIFDATQATAGLTDEQRRELLSHVEDSAEAKVRVGVPEVEAVADAFKELGDLRAITGRFPESRTLVAASEGWFALPSSKSSAIHCSLFFLAFFGALAFIVPKFFDLFRNLSVPLPGLTAWMMGVSGAAKSGWPLVLPLLVGLGFAAHRWGHRTSWKAVLFAFQVLSFCLCAVLMIALLFRTYRLFEACESAA